MVFACAIRTIDCRNEKLKLFDQMIRLEAEGVRTRALNPHARLLGKVIETRVHETSDGSAAVLRAAQAEAELDRLRATDNAKIDRALVALYGENNRGGIAKARTGVDADYICGYYLMSMLWRKVTEEISRPDSEDGPQRFKRRAYRAMEHMDEVGVYAFVPG